MNEWTYVEARREYIIDRLYAGREDFSLLEQYSILGKALNEEEDVESRRWDEETMNIHVGLRELQYFEAIGVYPYEMEFES